MKSVTVSVVCCHRCQKSYAVTTQLPESNLTLTAELYNVLEPSAIMSHSLWTIHIDVQLTELLFAPVIYVAAHSRAGNPLVPMNEHIFPSKGLNRQCLAMLTGRSLENQCLMFVTDIHRIPNWSHTWYTHNTSY